GVPFAKLLNCQGSCALVARLCDRLELYSIALEGKRQDVWSINKVGVEKRQGRLDENKRTFDRVCLEQDILVTGRDPRDRIKQQNAAQKGSALNIEAPAPVTGQFNDRRGIAAHGQVASHGQR